MRMPMKMSTKMSDDETTATEIKFSRGSGAQFQSTDANSRSGETSPPEMFDIYEQELEAVFRDAQMPQSQMQDTEKITMQHVMTQLRSMEALLHEILTVRTDKQQAVLEMNGRRLRTAEKQAEEEENACDELPAALAAHQFIECRLTAWHDRGYGFLLVNGQTCFVHANELRGGSIPKPGMLMMARIIQDASRGVGKLKATEAWPLAAWREDQQVQRMAKASEQARRAAQLTTRLTAQSEECSHALLSSVQTARVEREALNRPPGLEIKAAEDITSGGKLDGGDTGSLRAQSSGSVFWGTSTSTGSPFGSNDASSRSMFGEASNASKLSGEASTGSKFGEASSGSNLFGSASSGNKMISDLPNGRKLFGTTSMGEQLAQSKVDAAALEAKDQTKHLVLRERRWGNCSEVKANETLVRRLETILVHQVPLKDLCSYLHEHDIEIQDPADEREFRKWIGYGSSLQMKVAKLIQKHMKIDDWYHQGNGQWSGNKEHVQEMMTWCEEAEHPDRLLKQWELQRKRVANEEEEIIAKVKFENDQFKLEDWMQQKKKEKEEKEKKKKTEQAEKDDKASLAKIGIFGANSGSSPFASRGFFDAKVMGEQATMFTPAKVSQGNATLVTPVKHVNNCEISTKDASNNADHDKSSIRDKTEAADNCETAKGDENFSGTDDRREDLLCLEVGALTTHKMIDRAAKLGVALDDRAQKALKSLPSFQAREVMAKILLRDDIKNPSGYIMKAAKSATEEWQGQEYPDQPAVDAQDQQPADEEAWPEQQTADIPDQQPADEEAWPEKQAFEAEDQQPADDEDAWPDDEHQDCDDYGNEQHDAGGGDNWPEDGDWGSW